MWDISSALKQLRTYKSLNQKEFAEKIGVPRSSYCDSENGNRCPNVEFMRGIAIAFPDVNIDWLLTGNGEMLKGDTAANEALTFSNEDLQLLRLIKLLAPEQKNETVEGLKKTAQHNQWAVSHWLAMNQGGGDTRQAA